MGERDSAGGEAVEIEASLEHALKVASRLKLQYITLPRLEKAVCSDPCLKHQALKIHSIRERPLPTKQEIQAARKVAARACRALVRLKQAKKQKEIDIWAVREAQRERVVAISQKLQMYVVNRLQTTIGLKRTGKMARSLVSRPGSFNGR